MKVRTYSELIQYDTFDERFDYLMLGGGVGRSTFGFDRYMNQRFYSSREWEDIRRHIMLRDQGCDLGVVGYEIFVNPLVHHINPMGVEDLVHKEDWVLDPEFLILTSHNTHNNIHFGVKQSAPKIVTERRPGDTDLWRR
jgi:hypothetical protein